jgi:O-acetyl-ADP-ribose deacetylase (regulator of RNase III)
MFGLLKNYLNIINYNSVVNLETQKYISFSNMTKNNEKKYKYIFICKNKHIYFQKIFIMKIIFFDLCKEKIKIYKKILNIINEKNHSIKLEFYNNNLLDLVENIKFNYIVSPANSYGAMTGGIDTDICNLDETIQTKVYNHVKLSPFFDMDNEHYIPVGICEQVKINNLLTILMAPTMKHPKDISDTNNVFLAFNAILITLQSLSYHHHNLVIMCPCLGTGCGNMDAEKSAKQILHAFLVHQII